MATKLVPHPEQGDLLATTEHLPHIRPHSPIHPQALAAATSCARGAAHPGRAQPRERQCPWPCAATKAGVSLQSGTAPASPHGCCWPRLGNLQHCQQIPVPATTPWHCHTPSNTDPGRVRPSEIPWGRWHWPLAIPCSSSTAQNSSQCPWDREDAAALKLLPGCVTSSRAWAG